MATGSHSAAALLGGLIAIAAPAAASVTPAFPTRQPAAPAGDRTNSAAAPRIHASRTERINPAFDTAWLTTRKPLFEIVQSIATTLALLLGGIWAYFKVVKGRLYRARLEARIGGKIISGNGFRCAVFTIDVKNVSLSRVVIDRARSTIEVKAYPIGNYLPQFHNAILDTLGVVEAIRGHDWVEPGECITEDRLIALPANEIVALVIQLRLLEIAPRLRLRRSGVVWNSVAVLLPQESGSTSQGRKADQAPSSPTKRGVRLKAPS